MATLATPGVYVEEISTLPPSVAEVSTAIPAFLGYTEKGPAVARVSTFLEFQDLFGGPSPQAFEVTTDADGEVTAISRASGTTEYLMYYCLNHYFKNGGGPCYVLSTGNYGSNGINQADYDTGLQELEREDEPTLILLTDAVQLDRAAYYAVCQQALMQCDKLGDRFAIFDVKDGNVEDFRGTEDFAGIGSNHLKYGAAYHPYLQTSIAYVYRDDDVTITGTTPPDETPEEAPAESPSPVTLASIQTSETDLYNTVKAALGNQRIILPPSSAVAGIYASVDRSRGVWKAPANVSVASVIGPVEKITHGDQETLNVDATGGKSINAIRTFTGRGTLVWGARTLAGNDNEWRYVPVRRLFNMIEESSRKATAFAVFEPNDTTTWLKVKGMIESFLHGLWERGALAGPTPEAAFFVNVGLGKTMTTQDVLEGKMIVEIGVAAVRPAEFIILRFTHKLQEA